MHCLSQLGWEFTKERLEDKKKEKKKTCFRPPKKVRSEKKRPSKGGRKHANDQKKVGT